MSGKVDDPAAAVVPLRTRGNATSARGGCGGTTRPPTKTKAKTTTTQRHRRRRGGLASASSSSRDDDDDDEARDPWHDRRGENSRSSSAGGIIIGCGGGGEARRPRRKKGAGVDIGRESPSYSGGGLSDLALGDFDGAAGTDAIAKLDVASGMVDVDDNGTMDDGGVGMDKEDAYDDHDNDGLDCIINPSWDLLNQDSFGFNLLGSQGSLSFDTSDHRDDAERDIVVDDDERSRGKSIDDLTSAVTASQDDNPAGGSGVPMTMDWLATVPNGHHRHHQHHHQDTTTIVTGMTHNWIPPITMPQHSHLAHHHHHHQQQQQQQHYATHHHQRRQKVGTQHYHGVVIHRSSPYNPVPHHSSSPSYFVDAPPPPPHHHFPSHPPPLRESRSDITPHSYCNNNVNNDPIEMRGSDDRMGSSFENDPFKYAFDPPSITNGNNAHSSSLSPPVGKARQEGNDDRIHSRRNKKRKQNLSAAPTLSTSLPPIDERRNPSSTTRRRQDKSSSRDVREVAIDSSRSGMTSEIGSDKIFHRDGRPSPSDAGSNGRGITSSTGHNHGASPPTSSSVVPYPSFTSYSGVRGGLGAPVDTIHSAFLPPVPMTQRQQLPPLSSPAMVAYHNDKPQTPLTTSATPSLSKAKTGTNSKAPPHPSSSVGRFLYPHPPPPSYRLPPTVVPKSEQRRGGGAACSGNAAAPPPIPSVYSKGSWTAQAHPPTESRHHHHPMQQHQQQQNTAISGTALLVLPDGKRLSRSQAPGIGWPPEEDARLAEVMSNHKSSAVDWDALSLEHGMGMRTARECHDRWTRYLRPGSRKGQWREEEDAIVLRAIFSTGGIGSMATAAEETESSSSNGNASIATFTQWADLAPQLPGRTGKQIRDRWVNYLNPAINHLPFSRDDDLRLWRGHQELGKRWVEISVKVFHSTRSENHIKNRWYSAAFKKFISKEFGVDAYFDAKQGGDGNDD